MPNCEAHVCGRIGGDSRVVEWARGAVSESARPPFRNSRHNPVGVVGAHDFATQGSPPRRATLGCRPMPRLGIAENVRSRRAATRWGIAPSVRSGAMFRWGSRKGDPKRLRMRGCVFRAVVSFLVSCSAAFGDPASRSRKIVQEADARRIAVVDRVAPSVVCVSDSLDRGGGSGVIIDPQGYGLTNYHVVAGLVEKRRGLGGLSDGQLYELEVLGIDPTGDVAMFRLLGREMYPYSELGDSDAVQIGDTAIAMGNPFSLSEDSTPSVSVGLVTGTHRYQYGVGNNLIYSDCIQTDAAINPGNSGGPLFNEAGEIIGINGRISVNTRGRFNVGFGYAISSNQIKRFIPALRAGLLARHGTMEATVENRTGAVVFNEVRAGWAAYRAGVARGDVLLSLAGRRIDSANHFASLLGTYPSGWTVQMEIERAREPRVLTFRLDSLEPKLRKPFTMDHEVNQGEVRRVLHSYASTVTGDQTAEPPAGLVWSMTRRHDAGRDGRIVPPQYFDASWERGEPMRWVECGVDSGGGREVEFDEMEARRFLAGSNMPSEIPAEERLILETLYWAWVRLFEPLESLDLTEFMHVGADRVWPSEDGRLEPSAAASGMVEQISVPIPPNGTVTFGFEMGNGQLGQASIIYGPPHTEVTLQFSDHREIDGLTLPTRVRVRSGTGSGYVDELSWWEFSP